MKILALHCDYIKYKALKKALKSIPDLESKEEVVVDECLVVMTAVEKEDEGSSKVVDELVLNILDLKEKTGAEKVVLYPYAHLSSSLSSPDFAQEVLQKTEKVLNDEEIETYRAPFGYYKQFELKCKGHPLSELSREIVIKGEEESYDSKALLRQVSKAKLDTSKLKENDHRIIAKNLDLFSFHDVAPGMVFWHSKGWTIYRELLNYWRDEHKKAGYEEISTPQILDKKLWQISGHWEKFRENMFFTEYEKREFAVKPMNCPGGMLVFKSSPKSYKDLPLRVGEIGIVHRQELSGVLAGLFRVIRITQDDAHIFCNEKQLEDEIENIMDLIQRMYKKFGLEFDHLELSTRPEKRVGSDEAWDKAEKALENVLKKKGIDYKINEGDGAFYGPKIDFHAKDSLNRTWQLSTIQLDFAMPERFDLTYTDENNEKKRPIMLHRVVYGSLERFLGILLEHTNGNLPLWLAPIQARVLSFADRNIGAGKKFLEKLKEKGVRADGDFSSTKIGDKVRTAEMQKIPFMITIGDKEEEKEVVAVREKGSKGLKEERGDDFIDRIVKDVKERK